MTQVLIYGDSNSHGTRPGDGPRLDDDERWGGHLAAGLGAGWCVRVEGLPGRTIAVDDPVEGEWKNGLTVLPAILQSHAPIDVLAIMLGTNDQKTRFALGAVDIAAAAGRMLDRAARFTDARRLLICPPAVREAGSGAAVFGGAEARATGLAAHMEEVARQRGVAFFDANGVIETDPAEGVHFGPDAHAALGRALVPVIGELR